MSAGKGGFKYFGVDPGGGVGRDKGLWAREAPAQVARVGGGAMSSDADGVVVLLAAVGVRQYGESYGQGAPPSV